MRLNVVHTTRYEYGEPVTHSHNLLRLRPPDGPDQRSISYELSVEPEGTVHWDHDYFGNALAYVAVIQQHEELVISASSMVETSPREPTLSDQPETSWSSLDRSEMSNRFVDFVLPSRFTQAPSARLDEELETLLGRPYSELPPWAFLATLTRALPEEFEYRPGYSTVESSVTQLLGSRRGVCQDFTHLMIALCRHVGIPARYVGGYMFQGNTDGVKLEQGELSELRVEMLHLNHAWMEAYLPELGWCGFDPTNAVTPDERYVRVTRGRDYGDVPPVRGVYLSQSGGQMHVDVQVETMPGATKARPSHQGQQQQ